MISPTALHLPARACAVALAALSLGGCGAVVSSSGPAVDKAQFVASDFTTRPAANDLFAAVTPWADATRKFHLSRKGEIYAFPEGKSYFRTIALPANAAGRKLELRSYYSLDFPTTLFVPAFVFFGADKQILSRRPTAPYQIVNGLGEHIRVEEPIPARATHVVIYTTPQRVAERMDFKTYSMTGVVPTPAFASKSTGFGGFYEGILRLALKDD